MPKNSGLPIIEEVNITYFALVESQPGSPSQHMKQLEATVDKLRDTVDAIVSSSPGGLASKWGNSRLDHLGYDDEEVDEAPSPSRRRSPNKSQKGMSSKWGNSRLDHLGYDGGEDDEPPSSRGGTSPLRGKSLGGFSVKGSATEVARKMKNMSGVPAKLIRQYMEQRQQRPSLQAREDKLRKDAAKQMKHVKPAFQQRMDEHFLNQEEKRLMQEVQAALDSIEQMERDFREENLRTDAVDAMSHVKPKFQKRLDNFD